MKYNFKTIVNENGQEEEFIITDKTFKSKPISLKLNSIIKQENILAYINENHDEESMTISWQFKKEDNDIYLILDHIIENIEPIKMQIDVEKLLKEAVDVIINNKPTTNLKTLAKSINKTYNMLFNLAIKNNVLLFSNNSVEANVIVNANNESKTNLGTATRFILTPNKNLLVCEYCGNKPFYRHTNVNINMFNNNFNINYFGQCLDNDEFTVYHPNLDVLGYFECVGSVIINKPIDKDIQIYKYNDLIANKKYCYSSSVNMKTYILNNNKHEDIVKYKLSIKIKNKPININNYIVNEFSI